jgi:probable HAF family extracellular repeat protein
MAARCAGGNSRAFLWGNGGPIVDLNTLVGGADMTLIGPTSINDRGEITGLGVLANGDLHAFLLIPCDENLGDSGARRRVRAQPSRGATSQRPNVSIPETVRKLLQQRLGHRSQIPGLGGWPPK